MKVTFTISRKEESRGSEIYLRFSVNRDVILRAKTKIYVKREYWNEKTGSIKMPRAATSSSRLLAQIQSQLSQLESQIIENALRSSGQTITHDWLIREINSFHGITETSTRPDFDKYCDFFVAFDLFVEQRVSTEMRKKQFACLRRMLQRYELYRGPKYHLNLDKFSSDDLCDFDNFLSIEHTFFKRGRCIEHQDLYLAVPETRVPKERGGNARYNILKKFRTFYNWCFKTRRTDNNPFQEYKLSECVYGTPFYLTVEERNQLAAFDFSGDPALAVQRDIFIFQSLVGMRIGDLYRLTRENYIDGGIQYIPNKTLNETGRFARIPLTNTAKDIISRYSDYCAQNDKLLPFITEQHYNYAIKKCLRLAHIDRIVTTLNPTTRKEERHPIWEVASSHMARRNFIGNLYSKVKDPDLIASMTGHVEGSRAFSRYRNIDDDIKKDVLKNLD